MLPSSYRSFFLLITSSYLSIAAPTHRLPLSSARFCGNREIQDAISSRVRRSLPGEFGVFPKRILRYSVTRYPRHELHKRISQRELKKYVDDALRKAMKLWGEAIEVDFIESYGHRTDIAVSFSTFYHGDQYPFDGMGNEVAHAFYPSHAKRRGQIHIDDNEPWGPNGRNLDWVIAHEVGHTLGLPHTMRESIMMPQYSGFEQTEPQLFPYDIRTIQTLYGKREGFGQTNQLNFQNSLDEAPEVLSLCDNKPVDTIFALPNGTVVIFKGDHLWKLTEIGNMTIEGPQSIREFFGELELPVGAAFTDHLDWTWFIKGDRAWRVDASTDELRLSPPEEFHETSPFSNYVYNSIDAVLSISSLIDDESSPVFFFLGPKYWYDGNSDGDTDAGYYRHIGEIDETLRLRKVDDAVSVNEGNFIISGDSYWKVNPTRNSLKAEKGYPRSLSKDWFGCSESLVRYTPLNKSTSVPAESGFIKHWIK